MNILAWILVGLIGGLLARFLVPGRDKIPFGIIGTILLGIGGAILGGFIAVATGISNGVDDFDAGSIVLSVVGAIIILVGFRLVASAR